MAANLPEYLPWLIRTTLPTSTNLQLEALTLEDISIKLLSMGFAVFAFLLINNLLAILFFDYTKLK